MQLIFNIPDAKVPRIVEAINAVFPVPRDGNGNPLYTESQWAKKKIGRYIVNLVYQYELKKAREEAGASVEKDNELIS